MGTSLLVISSMAVFVAFLTIFSALSTAMPMKEECCGEKTVGGTLYYLVDQMVDPKAYNCINGCVYVRESGPGRFCFAKGELAVECKDSDMTPTGGMPGMSPMPPMPPMSPMPPMQTTGGMPGMSPTGGMPGMSTMDGMPGMSPTGGMPGMSTMDGGMKPTGGVTGCKCGKKKDERIIGGADTDINEWPWMVSMTFSDGVRHKCGGTVVASEWIVTAAHCLYEDPEMTVETEAEDISIVLGEHDNSMEGEEILPRKVVKVSKYIKHPNWDTGSGTFDADIALLKLAEKVDLNTYTPACMANTGDDFVGKTAWVYGWGALSFGTGDYPDKLQELSVKIVSQDVCQAAHNDLEWTITDGMLCAGGVTGQDSCQGDSGGPLTVDVNGQHHLVGDVSFGDDCAKEGRYGIYAKTAFFREWIDQTFAAEGGATYCPVE